jgi:hypothetical protein
MAARNYDSDSPTSSQASSTNTRYEWELLEEKINKQAMISYEKTKMPPHKMYGSQKINFHMIFLRSECVTLVFSYNFSKIY